MSGNDLSTVGVVGIDGVLGLSNQVNEVVVVTNAPKNFNLPAVYQIQNIDTNEVYIGATGNFHKRLKQHINGLKNNNHENCLLQKSFNSSNKLEIAVLPVGTIETAFLIEKELIKKYKGNDNFLNIRNSCPPPMTGRHHSPETKQKISEHHKKMYDDGYVNPFLGKKHTKELKQKQSEFAKKQWENPEFKDNQILKRIEIMKDPVNRERIANTVKALWTDSEYRDNQIKKHQEHASIPAVKANLSQKAILRMQDPANRQRSAEGAKKQWENPDYRANKIKHNQEIWQTPGYTENHVQKLNDHYKDPANRQRSAEGAKKLWNDPEFRDKMCKKVSINGQSFNSVKDAVTALGISRTSYYKNLKEGVYNG